MDFFEVENEFNLENLVDKLSTNSNKNILFHSNKKDAPLPSIKTLSKIMELLSSVIFPGYFGNPHLNDESVRYFIGSTLDELNKLLYEQILRGFCFVCPFNKSEGDCVLCKKKAKVISETAMNFIPKLKELLETDVIAGYNGDPAAKNYGEVIFCYPSIKTLIHHRFAHKLYELNVPLIPRIISEMAHSATGIDIHPGATIGKYFFMDHGTGIVVGETCRIGENVRIYQGVTLGAKSFPMDENGNPIKGIDRHPIVEDNVTIYSGATILGTVTIGKNSTIGGNVWIMKDVEANSKILK